MSAVAAMITGKGVGAIATVCIMGQGAGDIIKTVFKPIGKVVAYFEVGNILLGNIVDGEKIIDQVVVGCEGKDEFAINCHGNPLIVEMIMGLLAEHGAEAVSAEQFFRLKIKNKNHRGDSIATEAKLTQLKAKTIDGYKLLQNQISGGLSAKAAEWKKNESLEQIQKEADTILKISQTAQYLIGGCKVVIAGPANSGKSTLLNCLAGRTKSIVADAAGTTRDWVSATCLVGPLAMEIFDTAGLDESLRSENVIDKAAQQRSIELVTEADVVLWVLDGTDEKTRTLNPKVRTQNKIIPVINKSDLGLKMEDRPQQSVVVSAKNGTGIDDLTKKIRIILCIEGFDLRQAVSFTDRQQKLLENLCKVKNKPATYSIITELLNGPVCV